MHKHCPGFENAQIIEVADTIGIRESRHIEGEQTLTEKEVFDCVVQDSAIAVMATNMDTHNLNDAGGSFHVPDAGPYFGVPYLCLVAKGLDNLLVAGRCISADSCAASAIRMMPSCMAYGHAAGIAGAMAVKDGVAPKDIDVKVLREKLVSEGGFVG